jgi:hypothetical protein
VVTLTFDVLREGVLVTLPAQYGQARVLLLARNGVVRGRWSTPTILGAVGAGDHVDVLLRDRVVQLDLSLEMVSSSPLEPPPFGRPWGRCSGYPSCELWLCRLETSSAGEVGWIAYDARSGAIRSVVTGEDASPVRATRVPGRLAVVASGAYLALTPDGALAARGPMRAVGDWTGATQALAVTGWPGHTLVSGAGRRWSLEGCALDPSSSTCLAPAPLLEPLGRAETLAITASADRVFALVRDDRGVRAQAIDVVSGTLVSERATPSPIRGEILQLAHDPWARMLIVSWRACARCDHEMTLLAYE